MGLDGPFQSERVLVVGVAESHQLRQRAVGQWREFGVNERLGYRVLGREMQFQRRLC